MRTIMYLKKINKGLVITVDYLYSVIYNNDKFVEMISITCIPLVIFFGFRWACSGKPVGVQYREYYGSAEEHKRYINREMGRWEATVYENWTSRSFFGKIETIIKIIIVGVVCGPMLVELLTCSIAIAATVIFILLIIGGGMFGNWLG